MRRFIAIALVASGGVLAAPLPAPAQDQRAPDPRAQAADSIIHLAARTARAGDTTQALKLLERATKVAPAYAPAFYERGVLLSRASRLGIGDHFTRREASKELNRALELDPDNPRYLMELGRLRLKTPFLRLDAERLFGRALRAAERGGRPRELAEIHWELGQIYERRYLSTANRRIFSGAMQGVDADQARDDSRYVRDLFDIYTSPVPDAGELDYRKAEEHYRAALAADPAHEGATLGLLALLADAERVEEMLKVARAARIRIPESARAQMALGLALHRLDRDDEAEAAFDSALARLDSAERVDMTRLEQVTREEDAKKLTAIGTSSRIAMDSLFWDLADPLRLTRTNEARVEFLSRVTYADLRFSAPEFGQKGWKTDRGVIWVRYGPPPQVGSFAPETEERVGSDAMARTTTVWWYPESQLRFVFVGPPAMNYAFFAGDFRSYAENARYVAPMRLDNMKPRLRVDSIPVQIARFRGEQGTVDVSFFADVPTRRMLRDVDVAQALLETALYLGNQRRQTVLENRDSSIVRADLRDSVTSRAWRRTLAPGEYVYRIEARQPASGKAARGMAAIAANPFPAGTFALSDLLVAHRIAMKSGLEAPRSRDDLIIAPNASLTFAKRDTAHLYWETYGLTRDSTGNARMRVELALHLREIEREKVGGIRVLGALADAVGITQEGDDRVLIRYERTVALDASDRVANYLALDLADAPYGAYSVELSVTDLTTGKTVARQRDVRVPRP